MPATIRVRRAATTPALIGALACSVVAVPQPAAAADSPVEPWLGAVVHASAPPVEVVRGLTVQPVPRVLPVDHYSLTARFGSAGGLWSSGHTGLDFAAPEGTAIRAIAGGVVTEVGYDGSYGNKTVIRLADGTTLWFCHQSSVGVSVGEHVAPGQVIGAIGSTGNVTGPHLHLEVRVDGEPIDPEVALADWGLDP